MDHEKITQQLQYKTHPKYRTRRTEKHGLFLVFPQLSILNKAYYI
nr:C480 [uncultured bacterium]